MMTDFWNGRFKVFMVNMGHIMAVDRRLYMVCFKFCYKYSDLKASVPIKN